MVAPPPDLAHLDRLGLLYFLRPAHDLALKPIHSPLLERLGFGVGQGEGAGIKAGDWVKARVTSTQDRAKDGEPKQKVLLGEVKIQVYE